jgi:hypothetical protein
VLKPRRWWLCGAGLAVLSAALGWLFWPGAGDVRLKAYVHALPAVPIVFTSRSEPASFRAAAPAGEGFVYPGQPLWQARAGRLRLLTPRGAVHELTWGKALPDGGTLIDVMSPSLSMDATKILFAGRRADDHGHFRIYEIGIDGQGLRPLTGGPEDAGCTALPPLRYGPDGRTMGVAPAEITGDELDLSAAVQVACRAGEVIAGGFLQGVPDELPRRGLLEEHHRVEVLLGTLDSGISHVRYLVVFSA